MLTLVGMASAGSATKALKQKFSVPGKEGWVTNQQIAQRLPRHRRQQLAAAARRDAARRRRPSSSPACARELRGVEARAAAGAARAARVAGYASTGSTRVRLQGRAHDVHRRLPAAGPQPAFGDNPKAAKKRDAPRSQGATVAGAPVHLTGFDALSVQSGGGNGPGVLVEALLGGFGALLVLAFVFGSFLALVPILMAIVVDPDHLPGRLGPDDGHRRLADRAVPDRADRPRRGDRLLAARRRALARGARPRPRGRRGDRQRAMETAGRAVVFSGTTVAIGLLALVALPLPFLRSVGYGGMLIPLVSVLVALTLLPVVLQQARAAARLAARAQRRQGQPLVDRAGRSSSCAAAGSPRSARRVVLGALVLAADEPAARASRTSNTIAKQGDAKQGLRRARALGHRLGRAAARRGARRRLDARPTRSRARWPRCTGVHGAVAPTGAAVAPRRRRGRRRVRDRRRLDAASGRDTLDRVRDGRARRRRRRARSAAWRRRTTDFIDAVYGNFPLMIALIALITFVLLARAFRSLLLPLKAVMLNVHQRRRRLGRARARLAAAATARTLIWGIPATGSITAWIPLMVFAFLFGLSMDYEVFILARMREEYDAHRLDRRGGRARASGAPGGWSRAPR